MRHQASLAAHNILQASVLHLPEVSNTMPSQEAAPTMAYRTKSQALRHKS